MKKCGLLCILFAFLLLSVSACKKKENGIRIDEKTFPDEVFRKYVNEIIDEDWNGYLSKEEIEQTKSISCRNWGIKSFEGIEVFTNLEFLQCEANYLKQLDVSGLSGLKELDCAYNLLDDLNVSGLSQLTKLYCNHNRVKSLNVSGLVNLSELDCERNKLTVLDVTGLTKCNSISCDYECEVIGRE